MPRNDPEMPEFFSFSLYFSPRPTVQQAEWWRAQSDGSFRNQNSAFYDGTSTESLDSFVRWKSFTASTLDFAMQAEVGWLSRGKVLDRFMESLPAVRIFLEEKGRRELLAHLIDDTFVCNTAFVTDITLHLNSKKNK